MTGRIIDQVRASKLPSNMMQFAARGALQVPPAENIEILVHLALHNKVFGELARMTLAGWDEKASRAAASDPQTPAEVLDYFISPDNLRPRLLPALLENPAVPDGKLVKLALSATRETIDIMLKSPRVRVMSQVLRALSSSPYLKPEEVEELKNLVRSQEAAAGPAAPEPGNPSASSEPASETPAPESTSETDEPWSDEDGTVAAYLNDHMHDIEAEGDKPFHAIGGIVDLLGEDYFPVLDVAEAPEPAAAPTPAVAAPRAPVPAKKQPVPDGKRENALQKINHLDVKGRIQLALKGNKEERSLLIRDGTKVVALAVLEAPKLSDGEVEKFASQKNVLEAVLRQIPLKRRFMKNYKVVRNLVANPRTPLDLGLGLMKNLLIADLKNLSGNKEVSETIRKLAMKMYKQKLDAAAKK
jgi:hypothetical protein